MSRGITLSPATAIDNLLTFKWLVREDVKTVAQKEVAVEVKDNINTLKDIKETSDTSQQEMHIRSFEEVMEEVLEDRAEAWSRLADL